MAKTFRRVTCRGRKMRNCKSAKKSCRYASGSKRKFCRKIRNTKRRK